MWVGREIDPQTNESRQDFKMNLNMNKSVSWLAVAGMLALVSACDSGAVSDSATDTLDQVDAVGQIDAVEQVETVGQIDTVEQVDAVGQVEAVEQVSSTLVAQDFKFPTVAEEAGAVNVSVPEGPLPTFSARRTLSSGTGSTLSFGDPVVVRYSMYSWSSGELIETTDAFDEPVTIRAGVSEGVPDFLSKSLLGRKLGDRIQVVFESGMEDLPSYLDSNDAYILVVDLI